MRAEAAEVLHAAAYRCDGAYFVVEVFRTELRRGRFDLWLRCQGVQRFYRTVRLPQAFDPEAGIRAHGASVARAARVTGYGD